MTSETLSSRVVGLAPLRLLSAISAARSRLPAPVSNFVDTVVEK